MSTSSDASFLDGILRLLLRSFPLFFRLEFRASAYVSSLTFIADVRLHLNDCP